MKRFAASVTLATVMLTGSVTSASASVTDPQVISAQEGTVTTQGQGGCTPVRTDITNVKNIGNAITSPSGPEWQVSGRGPITLQLSKSVSVSNSFTGGVAPSFASIGFDVNKTTGTDISASVAVPSGATWVLRARQIFAVKSFSWHKYNNCGVNQSGTGTARNFTRFDYTHYAA